MNNITTQGLVGRLWQYQKERFPLFKTALLVAIFSSATLIVTARLGNHQLSSGWTFIAIWLAILFIFFQMRVLDEYKDQEIDAKYRPERPVPRGLVTLLELRNLALLSAAIVIALTLSLSWTLVLPLAIVWIWLALMTKEFFITKALQARPILYLTSHMIILPLINLYASAGVWTIAGTPPPKGLAIYLVMSFFIGCVLEIGRKLKTPENEREGVETYSALWGIQRAVTFWRLCIGISASLLLVVSYGLGTMSWTLPVLSLTLAYIWVISRQFVHNPSPKLETKIDNLSGIWVMLAYGLSALPPLFTSLG